MDFEFGVRNTDAYIEYNYKLKMIGIFRYDDGNGIIMETNLKSIIDTHLQHNSNIMLLHTLGKFEETQSRYFNVQELVNLIPYYSENLSALKQFVKEEIIELIGSFTKIDNTSIHDIVSFTLSRLSEILKMVDNFNDSMFQSFFKIKSDNSLYKSSLLSFTMIGLLV